MSKYIRCCRPRCLPEHYCLRLRVITRLGICNHDRRTKPFTVGEVPTRVTNPINFLNRSTNSKGYISNKLLTTRATRARFFHLNTRIKAGTRHIDRITVHSRRIKRRHHRGHHNRRLRTKVGGKSNRPAALIRQNSPGLNDPTIFKLVHTRRNCNPADRLIPGNQTRLILPAINHKAEARRITIHNAQNVRTVCSCRRPRQHNHRIRQRPAKLNTLRLTHRRRNVQSNSACIANTALRRHRINRIHWLLTATTGISSIGRRAIQNEPIVAHPNATQIIDIGIARCGGLRADHVNHTGRISCHRSQTRGLSFELTSAWVVEMHRYRTGSEHPLRGPHIDQRSRAFKPGRRQGRCAPIHIIHKQRKVLVFARNHLMAASLVITLRGCRISIQDVADILPHHQLMRATCAKETVFLTTKGHGFRNLNGPAHDLGGHPRGVGDSLKPTSPHLTTDRGMACGNHRAIDRGLICRITRAAHQDV